MKHYIGITGIDSKDKVKDIIQAYPEEHKMDFMIGGCASYKTILGIKTTNITLSKEEIFDIYNEVKSLNRENVLFTIHYWQASINDIREERREAAETILITNLSSQVKEVFKNIYRDYEQNNYNFNLGVQLNVLWPSTVEVEQIKKEMPKLQIIQQINNLESIENKIGDYDVSGFLLDQSRGFAKDMDVDFLAETYLKVQEKTSALIGLAGGLSADNVYEKVKQIRSKIGDNFFFDAQGKLRTNKEMDVEKVKAYLSEAARAFY